MTEESFVLLVTDGTLIEYPPEIYSDLERGRLEAERWAWVLAGGGWREIARPFTNRWRVADRDIRLVPVEPSELTGDLWVGTYWIRDGYPDPEAIILANRDDARAWVLDEPAGMQPVSMVEELWWLAATYRLSSDDQTYAVASLAKVVNGTGGYSGGRSADEPKTTT